MSYEVNWLVPDRIIEARYWGVLTVDEIRQSNTAMDALINQVATDKPVHIIADLSLVETFPVTVSAITGSRPKPPEAVEWIVLVHESRLLKFISGMVGQLMHLNNKVVATKQEALDFLAISDPTLPDGVNRAVAKRS